MAIDMISETHSPNTSPRISFSHGFCHKEVSDSAAIATEDFPSRANYSPTPNQELSFNPELVDPNSSILDFNPEFDFCISNCSDTETSSADELFSHGVIRPLQLQQKIVTSKPLPLSKTQPLSPLPPTPLPQSQNETSDQEILIKQIGSSTETEHQNKSFWNIKRSSSVHCVNSSTKKSSFWSLPLLSRSNSTGSVPNSKQSTKEAQKQSQQFKNLYTFPPSSSSSQKPPLRKNYYANGVRINQVLNLPPPGTANLFGFGSLFRSGKEKKIKK